ncbi:MAG: ABC transporter permease [Chloroflexi bacterium]|nr:ABC transporter permease [Chloroflexota bacterium]
MATRAIQAGDTSGALSRARRPRRLHTLPLALRIVVRRARSLIAVTIAVSVALALALALAMLLIAMSRAIFSLMLEDCEIAGTDLSVIERGAMFLPLLPGDSPGEIGDARAALATIRNLPGVSGAVGVTSWQLERGVEGPRGDIPAPLAAVVGVTDDAERIPNQILLSHGRWFRRDNEIVVGPELVKDLHLSIGDPIILGGRRFTVVGIGRVRGVGLGSFRPGFTFISYDALADLAPIRNVMTSILVDSTEPERTAREIEPRVDRVGVCVRSGSVL